MLEVNRALAQLLRPTLHGASLDDMFVHMGKLVGRIDLSGVYANLIRTRAVSETAHRLTAMWKQYHNTGTLEVALEPNAARFELRDHGLPSRELCLIQRGWFSAYIELTGATQHSVVETQCRQEGAATCVWSATWR
jgi:predicted hydrocarbon binding protein